MTGRRPRVLHLAYEDPRKPGAGGGSVRTSELNRRLAADFDLTVVTMGFPGAVSWHADGVTYLHTRSSGRLSVNALDYFARLPVEAARRDVDLVIEDFGAPISTYGLPWLSRKPVVGVVQWLFAREKAKQYRLPFGAVESVGLRAHSRLIAVSDDLGRELTRRVPSARVHVVKNGVDPIAADATGEPGGGGIVFVGRLDVVQKGVDLLLQAYATIAGAVAQDLTIVGTGPDEGALRALAQDLGVGDRVHFAGEVLGAAKFALLRSADVVAMPSRYETFGMVAAEALTVGTPVVCFDIPCLRELVSGSNGARVPAFDVEQFAAALQDLCSDKQRRRELASNSPASVAHLQWDLLAEQQAAVYRTALGEAS